MAPMSRLVYRYYRLMWSSLDWLYPPNCGGCGKPGRRWCPDCQQSTEIITPPFCSKCGQTQEDVGLCVRCRYTTQHYTALRSWAVFRDGLRKAIHRLKYRRDMSLGEILSRPLIHCLETYAWHIDIVIPVPLGLARLAERGYNQSALLARPFALGAELAYYPQALRRIRETQSQVGLSMEERRLNVDGAFQANKSLAEGHNILIIDDVATSGATIDACAVALLNAGANEVYGLTLARAVRHPVGVEEFIQ